MPSSSRSSRARHCFKGLVRLAFAARELPQPAQVRIGVALGDEQLAVAEDQGGGDINDGMAWGLMTCNR